MINATFRRIACASIALCATAMFQVAHAELGGTATFTQPANKTIQPVEQTGLFRVRSTIDDGGTTINEYASTSGQVFGYTWQGPTMPDLQTLLGKYYDSYRVGTTPDATTPRNLHASRVTRPDVIVESGGQMRSYAGRAWLPGALPAGVFPDDLR
ncbi:hypothetical protein P3T23_008701 [Paraburkholderia sp. GAS448]|uniref:DUF2844 domain-containing protein n=1 Tax=Paraburkholderia sp. GAS448 TaxID=3035136 RepID=UPI003D258EFE